MQNASQACQQTPQTKTRVHPFLLLLFHFSDSVSTVLSFVMSQSGLIVSVQAASTLDLILRRTCCISPSFSMRPPIVLLRWSATQSATTFTLSLAQTFGPRLVAAHNHVFRRSETNATQWTTWLSVTQWVLLCKLHQTLTSTLYRTALLTFISAVSSVNSSFVTTPLASALFLPPSKRGGTTQHQFNQDTKAQFFEGECKHRAKHVVFCRFLEN